MKIDKLGEIPFSSALGAAAEDGTPITISAPDSDIARAFKAIAQEVVTRLN
jgi:MinD-like ATPase involved in chromosome partitioning or flagellar assembly